MMKKFLALSLLTVTGLAHADFGSSFAGGMTGGLVSGVITNAASQPKTQVVYVNDDGEQVSTSSRKNKRKMQALQDENDSLRDENAQLKRTQADMNARLNALEAKVK